MEKAGCSASATQTRGHACEKMGWIGLADEWASQTVKSAWQWDQAAAASCSKQWVHAPCGGRQCAELGALRDPMVSSSDSDCMCSWLSSVRVRVCVAAIDGACSWQGSCRRLRALARSCTPCSAQGKQLLNCHAPDPLPSHLPLDTLPYPAITLHASCRATAAARLPHLDPPCPLAVGASWDGGSGPRWVGLPRPSAQGKESGAQTLTECVASDPKEHERELAGSPVRRPGPKTASGWSAHVLGSNVRCRD